MAKYVLDNCTIYRLLDRMDESVQRTLVLNALRNCKEKIETDKELREKEYANLLSLLNSHPFNMKKVAECLISIYFLDDEMKDNKREIANAEVRMQYLDGIIPLEEMQKTISDTMEIDEQEFHPTAYNYELLHLLSLEPDEITLNTIDELKGLKQKCLQGEDNPLACKFPKYPN